MKVSGDGISTGSYSFNTICIQCAEPTCNGHFGAGVDFEAIQDFEAGEDDVTTTIANDTDGTLAGDS